MNIKRMLILFGTVIIGITLVLICSLFLSGPHELAHAAGPWYVAPDGSDSDSCLSALEPCATINGAIGKASSADLIYVATGIYTGTTSDIVLLDKDVTLSGGWDETFNSQNSASIIDGENSRRGILVSGEVTATLEYFSVQHGSSDDGGGIFINGTLELDNCSIISNTVSDEGGGVFIQSEGSLTLNQSSIGNNEANSGGGIFSAWGTLNINNSTLHNNYANGGGGINNLGGTVSLNSTTISRNEVVEMSGGGIRNEGGSVTLQNTIIAGNYGDAGPDCNGGFTSSGYNLIGDNSECAFTSGTGDLVNLNPGLYPSLMGSPAYYVLLPNSPTIDSGNPTGCTDHEASILYVDQRGSTRPVDGNGDSSALCDIGAYEYDPANPETYQVSIPCIFDNHCPNFFDDFSNPASGWPELEDKYIRAEYLDGEYRLLTKDDTYIHFFYAPTCDRQNYVLEVDARWIGTPGLSYGLLFGRTGRTPAEMYIFDVNTDYRDYALYRFDDGYNIVPPTPSSAINGGTGSNHLKVTRSGEQIKLEINGEMLGTWVDEKFTGLTGMGLIANPYLGEPISDVRYDNFSVTSLPITNTIATEYRITGLTGIDDLFSERQIAIPKPNVWRVP